MTVKHQPVSGNPLLHQYFTAVWVAEALIERHFANLDSNDFVVEPSCGTGAFLGAIPRHVPAIGVEIDPELAKLASANTGREVIQGDFPAVEFDCQPTAIVGNPPFATDDIERFIAKAGSILPRGGRMGLILPAYAFQTSSRLARWAEDWSIQQEALPRDLFPGLSKPLAFLLFSKDARKSLIGFALYLEAAENKMLPKSVRETLARAVGQPAWKTCLTEILQAFGGEANLSEIYQAVGPRRPTKTQFWREQTRKVLHESFKRVGDGRWALPDDLRRAA